MRILLRTIMLSMIMLACSRKEHHLELQREISSVHDSPVRAVDQVCQTLSIPCGIENFDGGFVSFFGDKQIDVNGYTGEAVLDQVVRLKPSCQWSFSDGVLNIVPTKIPPDDPLEHKIANFSVIQTDSCRAMGISLRQAGITPGGGGGGSMSRPICDAITVNLTNVTVREALNRIAKADGKISWIFSWSHSRSGNLMASINILSYRGYKPFEFVTKKP
jgi:hypothetical protein